MSETARHSEKTANKITANTSADGTERTAATSEDSKQLTLQSSLPQ